MDYCEARTWKDGKCYCHTREIECKYKGESPSYKCSEYLVYRRIKNICEDFFAWRKRVNKCW